MTPSEFPGGLSDTLVLTGYANHIVKCVYDGYERDLINVVSNGDKLYNFSVKAWTVEWWEPTLKVREVDSTTTTDLCSSGFNNNNNDSLSNPRYGIRSTKQGIT
ncbi:hypothetical protein P8452_26912 [Trifolium repens]|nr:hypothetical protein P8452_26912 [Trifolium repens]